MYQLSYTSYAAACRVKSVIKHKRGRMRVWGVAASSRPPTCTAVLHSGTLHSCEVSCS